MTKILYYLLIGFFIIFPFGQLGRLEIGTITIHLLDISAAVLVGTWLITKPKFTHPLAFHFYTFLGIALFSLLINLIHTDKASAFIGISYFFRLLIYVLFGFAVFDLLDRKIISKDKLLSLLKGSGVYLLLFGVFQYILFPDLRALQNWGWDNHYFRLVGTLLDPGFFGLLAVLVVLLEITKKNFSLLPFLGIATIAATYSRASYLALLAGLAVINVLKLSLSLTLKIILFFGIVLFLLPKPGGEGVNLERTSTVGFRVSNYMESIETFKISPIWGIGFNLYGAERDVSPESHSRNGADSSILFILATTGVIGLLIYLNLLQKIIFTKDPLLVSSTIVILVHSFFNNSIFYPWVMGWWFVLIAITFKDYKKP